MSRNNTLAWLREKRRELIDDLWSEWRPDGEFPVPSWVDDLRGNQISAIAEPEPDWESYLTPLGQQIFSELRTVDGEIAREESREYDSEVAESANAYYHH